jgi:hypothetical protein
MACQLIRLKEMRVHTCRGLAGVILPLPPPQDKYDGVREVLRKRRVNEQQERMYLGIHAERRYSR